MLEIFRVRLGDGFKDSEFVFPFGFHDPQDYSSSLIHPSTLVWVRCRTSVFLIPLTNKTAFYILLTGLPNQTDSLLKAGISPYSFSVPSAWHIVGNQYMNVNDNYRNGY